MKIKLPGGYTLTVNASARITPPPVYYLYILDRENECFHVGATSTDRAFVECEAVRLLQEKYGETDTWFVNDGSQWIHPNSPSGGKSGSPLLDAFVSIGEMHR